VAAEQAIRCEGLQVLTFWEVVVDLLSERTDKPKATNRAETPVMPGSIELNPYPEKFDPAKYFAYTRPRSATITDLIIAEDNQAVIKIIQKARSMALRHLPRAHRIDLQWLFEVCSNPRVQMRYVGTLQQIADLMTKALNKPETWSHLLDIAQIRGGITSEAKTGKPLAALLPDACCSGCGFVVSNGDSCPCQWT
jgi:hypothetical protein